MNYIPAGTALCVIPAFVFTLFDLETLRVNYSIRSFHCMTETCSYDDNYFISDSSNDYVSVDAARSRIPTKSTNDILRMHINIRSLSNNISELENLLAQLDVKPGLLAISDTKITETVNSFYAPQICEYHFHNAPSIVLAYVYIIT